MDYDFVERVRAILESVADDYNESGRMTADAPDASGGAIWRMRIDLESAGPPRIRGEIGIKYSIFRRDDKEDEEQFIRRWKNTRSKDVYFGSDFHCDHYYTDDDIRSGFQASLALAHMRVKREAAT
jgi:hypothetical protein